MNLGNKILELRKRNNLSQEQLANIVEVSRQTISKWELGETSPDISQANKLSNVFKVSLDELVNNKISKFENQSNRKGIKFFSLLISLLLVTAVPYIFTNGFSKFEKQPENNFSSNTTIEESITCLWNGKTYKYTIVEEFARSLELKENDNLEEIDAILQSGEFIPSDLTEYVEVHFKRKGGSCFH